MSRDKGVPVITFIGFHDSGKTTLVCRVVEQLTARGIRLAVIKSSKDCGICFDTPETDTAKHRAAGAQSVLFVAPDQIVLQGPNRALSLVELARRYFPEVDLVIGEGFKEEEGVQKIEVVRDRTKRLRGRVPGVVAVATDLDLCGENVFDLNDARGIADFLVKTVLQNRVPAPAAG